jgi:hypothetical protein
MLVEHDKPIADWALAHSDFVEIYRDSTARLLVRRLPQFAGLIERWGQQPASSEVLKRSVPFPG